MQLEKRGGPGSPQRPPPQEGEEVVVETEVVEVEKNLGQLDFYRSEVDQHLDKLTDSYGVWFSCMIIMLGFNEVRIFAATGSPKATTVKLKTMVE